MKVFLKKKRRCWLTLFLALSFLSVVVLSPPAQNKCKWLEGVREWFSPPTANPNLTVEIKKTRVQGYQVSIEYIIRNTGRGNTPFRRPFICQIYINGEIVGQETVPSLGAGARHLVCKDYRPQFWKKNNIIGIVVDQDNEVEEENEYDNNAHDDFVMDSFTDLSIRRVEFEESAGEGEAVVIKVTVENKGNTAALNPTAELVINNKEKIRFSAFDVAPHEAKTISMRRRADTPFITGTNQIRVTLKPCSLQEDIEKEPRIEQEEFSLEVARLITLPAQVDLQLKAVLCQDDRGRARKVSKRLEVKEDEPLFIKPQVRNNSREEVSSVVRVLVDGKEVYKNVYVLLPQKEFVEENWVVIKPGAAGRHTLLVNVEAETRDGYQDIRLKNNSRQIPVAVVSSVVPVDLSIDSILYRDEDGQHKIIAKPLTIRRGETFYFKPQITNKGSNAGAGVVTVTFNGKEVYRENYFLEPNSKITPDSWLEVEMDVVGAGNFAAQVEPVSEEDYHDTNPGNNTCNASVRVKSNAVAVDLALTGFLYRDSNGQEQELTKTLTLNRGETLYIKPQLTNFGRNRAEGKVTVIFDGKEVSCDLYRVQPKEEATPDSWLAIEMDVAGIWDFQGCVSPVSLNDYRDTNLRNNSKTVSVRVVLPPPAKEEVTPDKKPLVSEVPALEVKVVKKEPPVAAPVIDAGLKEEEKKEEPKIDSVAAKGIEREMAISKEALLNLRAEQPRVEFVEQDKDKPSKRIIIEPIIYYESKQAFSPEVKVALYLDGRRLDTGNFILPPGKPTGYYYLTHREQEAVAGGAHCVKAVLDPDGQINEINETDNEAVVEFEVAWPKEVALAVESLGPSAGSREELVSALTQNLNNAYRAADSRQVMACFSPGDFANYGILESTLADFFTSVDIGGFQVNLSDVSFQQDQAQANLNWLISLTKKATREVLEDSGSTRIRLKLIDGQWKITYVDDLQAFIYSEVKVASSAGALPDMLISGIDIEKKELAEIAVTHVKIEVTNEGKAAAQDIAVRMYDNAGGRIVLVEEEKVIDRIGPYESKSVELHLVGRYPAGVHEVRAVVDEDNKIKEVLEDNNSRLDTITVIDNPDISFW